ncbi:substrate-binding domain-containing protein [Williamsia sp. MIQD14]|uniref:substrate-binding domain-containing protein n=1 Tax=Williamsia sp. MIQD14 TaxID=3425703 RepID=UPI003DA157AB
MGRHHAADESTSASRRGSDTAPPQRRRRGLLMSAAVVVIALAAGGVVWATLADSAGPDCDSRTGITIAADPSMTTVLKSVAPQASENSCFDYTVSAVAGTGIAGELTRGEGAPDLWVADSTGRATTVTRQVRVPTDIVVPSVATTPAVVVGSSLPQLPDWVSVMKLPDLRIGSPLDSSTGNAPIVGALASVEKGTLSSKDLTDAMTLLAIQQGNVRTADDSEESRLALAESSGVPVVTTEQQFLSHTAATPTTKLTEAVPAVGTAFLDHPMLVTAAADRRDTAREAGQRFAREVSSAAGQTALAAQHYRPPTRAPLAGTGVGDVAPIALRDPSQQTKTLRQWAVVAEPIRTLVAMDVSGSMEEQVGSSTRAELLVQAALTGNKLFPNNTAIGMWYFSVDKGGPGQDWVEIAPIEREDHVRPDGRTQREFLNSQAQDYQRYVGGGTGLYDTTLAAYKKVLDTYDPNYSNSIIVLTDGRNEDPGSMGLSELLSKIRALQDPARPIDIVTIGISADADTSALQQIADLAPAGTSYQAKDPTEIPSVLVDAVAARVTAAGR